MLTDEIFKMSFLTCDNKNLKNLAFTIISKNYLHYALTLRESFLKHNKDYGFIIFLTDIVCDAETMSFYAELNKKGVDIRCFLTIKKYFKDLDLEDMLVRYDIIELNTAVKPYVFEYLFKEGYQKVIYIDPDIYFKNKITKLDTLLDEYDVVLTPHTIKQYPNDKANPSHIAVAKSGIYNLGFLALKNTDNSLELVRFWQTHLFDKCYRDFYRHLYVDQKWMDWTPSIFDKVFILKDCGYNMAYWNLHDRKIHYKNSEFYANNDLLVFFHFSGFKIDNYENITGRQTRFKLSDFDSDTRILFEEYNEKVKSMQGKFLQNKPYYFNHFTLSNKKLGLARIKQLFYRRLSSVVDHIYSVVHEMIVVLVKANMERKKGKGMMELEHVVGLNLLCDNDINCLPERIQNFYQNLLISGVPFSIININNSNRIEQPFSKNVFLIDAEKFEKLYKNNKELFNNKSNIAEYNSSLIKDMEVINFNEIQSPADIYSKIFNV